MLAYSLIRVVVNDRFSPYDNGKFFEFNFQGQLLFWQTDVDLTQIELLVASDADGIGDPGIDRSPDSLFSSANLVIQIPGSH